MHVNSFVTLFILLEEESNETQSARWRKVESAESSLLFLIETDVAEFEEFRTAFAQEDSANDELANSLIERSVSG